MNLFDAWRPTPDRNLITGNQNYTAAEALNEIRQRLAWLDEAKIAPGETIVAATRPSTEFFFWFAAFVARGVRLLTLNPALPKAKLAEIIAEQRNPWLLAPITLAPTIHAKRIPLAVQGRPTARVVDCSKNFTLLLQTSGTTGRPKCVPLQWQQLHAHAKAAQRHLGLLADDAWAASLPVHHIGGLSVLIRCIALGCRLAIEELQTAEQLNQSIDGGTITHASIVPTQLSRMLDLRKDRPFPASLRMLLIGGAALSESLAARARAIKAPLAPTYGMTETASQICTLPPEQFLAGTTGCGRPLPGIEVSITDEKHSAGMIRVRGTSVTAGYLGMPPVRDWFPTGDIGAWKDGSLHILDRRTDLIISGGENVYPSQVELVLHEFLQGAECAVIGLPDEAWGQRVVAVIVAESIDEPALRAHCKEQLAPHQIPKEYILLPELPKTSGGKVQRETIRSWLRAPRHKLEKRPFA